eukprot:6203549-Pleurochrysis_carterae.AAC.3
MATLPPPCSPAKLRICLEPRRWVARKSKTSKTVRGRHEGLPAMGEAARAINRAKLGESRSEGKGDEATGAMNRQRK